MVDTFDSYSALADPRRTAYFLIMNKEYTYYFSEKALLSVLVKKRVLLAKKRHDEHFLDNLVDPDNETILLKSELYRLFPARKQWIRLTAKERKGKSALEINAISLERTVLRLTKKFTVDVDELWYECLIQFISDIQKMAFSDEYSLPKPKIIPLFKKMDGKTKIYRPIAVFDLKNKILISQTNKYLTSILDQVFSDNSYAFRSVKKAGQSYTHHLAVSDILDYKREINDDLWASECDIKKFYDVINHSIIEETLKIQIKKCEQNGISISDRAIALLRSYLDCYTFNFDVLKIKMPPNSEFGWVKEDELIHVGSDPQNDKLGIPQGGAFSCLIANMVMDRVDQDVLQAGDEDLFYARFCDDMVILHPSQQVCENILEVYMKGLKMVKLIGHQPEEIKKYSNSFWKSKSKSPYKWAAKSNPQNVPWLAFVGYQISSDLRVRVRKDSIAKELQKQVIEVGKVVSLLKSKKNIKVSPAALKFRIKQRLFTMSVGRKSIFQAQKAGVMCWTAGFKVLKEEDNLAYQLKKLDRKRSEHLARLDAWIDKTPRERFPKTKKLPPDLENEPDFYGAPYSYHYQLMKYD